MLDALIVEPALDKRTNLREIARDICKSVTVSSSLKDGLERVGAAQNCDVIYVSSRFDLEAATQFVLSTKQMEAGKDSANLMIGCPAESSGSFLASLTLKGFDGMLIEPASVETFKVSAEVALQARKQKLAVRMKKSIEIMVKSLADHLDDIALKRKTGQSSILAQDKFEKMCHQIAALDIEGKENYFSAVVDCFSQRIAPKVDTSYQGASRRMLTRIKRQ